MKRIIRIVVISTLIVAALMVAPAAAAPPSHQVIDLGYGWANAINERGQVVGISGSQALLCENGIMTDLGATRAVAINERGQAVSWGPASPEPSSDYHAFLWQNGATTDLGPGFPVAINERGQVVDYGIHAFLWENGTITDLGPLSPGALNQRGQVVSSSASLSENGTTIYLPTLGGDYSSARDINNRGQVVGLSTTAASRRSTPFSGPSKAHEASRTFRRPHCPLYRVISTLYQSTDASFGIGRFAGGFLSQQRYIQFVF